MWCKCFQSVSSRLSELRPDLIVTPLQKDMLDRLRQVLAAYRDESDDIYFAYP
jgi:hypothetical protein